MKASWFQPIPMPILTYFNSLYGERAEVIEENRGVIETVPMSHNCWILLLVFFAQRPNQATVLNPCLRRGSHKHLSILDEPCLSAFLSMRKA